MQAINRKGGNISRDFNRFYWASPIAKPTSSTNVYGGIGGRQTVWVNLASDISPQPESTWEPNEIDYDGVRDAPVKLNHIKLDAVVQPLDSCIENNRPSNYPGTLHWCLYAMKSPATIPFPAIYPEPGNADEPSNFSPWLWSYAYQVPGFFLKNVLDFGVCAICPQRQWPGQQITYAYGIYEVNEETEAGVTEGLLTPVPPTDTISFNGWYAGGSDTSAKITIDKKFDDVVLDKNSLLCLEYRLECERLPPIWFAQNVSATGDESFAQLAVKINGAVMVEYTV